MNSLPLATLRWLSLAFLLAAALPAQPTAPPVPAAAQSSAHFDAEAATNAWLATVPPAQKQRSDAYFEGGYWLILWDFLYLAVVSVAVLSSGLSARMRDLAERISRRRFLVDLLYWVQYLLLSSIALFPLTVYEGFTREHQYGLANQDFAGWMSEQLTGLMIGLVIGGIAVAGLFAVIRRLPRTWHLWGAVCTILFTMAGAMLAPVYIAPLFNRYTSLKDARIKQGILQLARANGIPVTDVFEFNASKQSKRVSANVSGFLGTTRISLNDNLLNRCTPEQIQAVMGHEMGHYVMNHIYKAITFSMITTALMFWLLRRSLERSLERWGARWKLRAMDDIAVLPLALLLFSFFSLLGTPIQNSFIRTQEFEADMYGLNAARQPDGEAVVDLMLGEYRKLDPAPLEELIFFDHPSGRTRIQAAMRWKAENLPTK